MNTRPTLTGIGTVILWAALFGLATVLACAAITAAADWIVNTVFPWLAAEPERQAIVVLGAAALVALAASEVVE